MDESKHYKIHGEVKKMFMEIAIGAIGIGVVLMVGYLVISQVRSSLQASLTNSTADVATNVSINTAQTTVFAGFGLIAVGIIVLAAFGLISIFK